MNPDPWVETELGNLITLQRGFDLPVRKREEGSVPVIASSGEVGRHSESKVQPPGVVTGRSGSLGGAQLIKKPFWPLNTTLWVKDFQGNDPRFCYYLLKSLPLAHLNAGTTVPTLNRNHAHRLPILRPPASEQRTMAQVLGSLDDKIDLNREMNRTLEAVAHALFRSWFVDFDPVVAKADGRQPFGVSADVASLFPDRFVDSELGPIPEGWEWGELRQAAKRVRQGVHPADVDSDTPYIGLDHMPRKQITLSEWGRAGEVSSNKSSFDENQMLFGKLRPYFHKVGVAFTSGICSTDILVIKAGEPDWWGFVLGHLSSDELIAHADATSTGTRQPRTNWKSLGQYRVCLPPLKVAARYLALIRPIIGKLRANVYESRILADLRDTLLPKLLSGEIRVTDAERAIEASA